MSFISGVVLGLTFTATFVSATAQAAPKVEFTLSSNREEIMFHVRLPGEKPGKRDRWVLRLRHEVNGEMLTMGEYKLAKSEWSRSYPRSFFCGSRTSGAKPIVLQAAIQSHRGRWWNRHNREWQSPFLTYEEKPVRILCDVGGDSTTIPPDDRPKPVMGPYDREPRGDAPPPAVEEPPQPEVVPETSARGLLADLRANPFDNRRVEIVRDFVSRVGAYRLSAGQASSILRLFSFDSRRLDTVRALAPVLLRPVRAHEIAAMVKSFSFENHRADAVVALCRGGIADPLNISEIGRIFTFDNTKRKAMSSCR